EAGERHALEPGQRWRSRAQRSRRAILVCREERGRGGLAVEAEPVQQRGAAWSPGPDVGGGELVAVICQHLLELLAAGRGRAWLRLEPGDVAGARPGDHVVNRGQLVALEAFEEAAVTLERGVLSRLQVEPLDAQRGAVRRDGVEHRQTPGEGSLVDDLVPTVEQ